MTVIIQENYSAELLKLTPGSVDLLIVVYPEFAGAGVRAITSLGEPALAEGGALIIAPTLADALLAL